VVINTKKVNNSKLAEGKYYWFNIIKILELDNNNNYYVLEDPFGYKVLMPSENYKDYDLKPGEKVLCRVDKINCSGKMFVEPEHPYYKEGQTYYFKYIESKERFNFFDQKEHIIIVSDVFNNKWEVKTKPENFTINSDEVECFVEKIKKGKLFLRKVNDNTTSQMIKLGQYEEFVIVDEKTDPENNRQYYILEDKDHNKHLLQKKHYYKYRLKTGQKIKCRFDKLSIKGYYYLEPVHPYYEIGKKYNFPLVRIDKLVFSNNINHYSVVVEDLFGDEVFIDWGESIDDLNIEAEQVECLVKDFHRGKPVLQIIL